MDENLASNDIQTSKEPTPPPVKPLGILRDPNGDFSSGRLIKVGSFFMAVLLAGFLCLSLITHNKENPADPATTTAISIAIGSFLTIAGASEITQKITKT